MLILLNSNGREMAGYDTQPAKFAARQMALHGTLTLDNEIARAPALAERAPFVRDRAGHYRSAYSPVGQLSGGAVAWLLKTSRLVDLDAGLAPNLIAALTPSILMALAISLVFLTVTRLTSARIAIAVAVGLGLGTTLWVQSRSLGQHDVVAFGMALCLYAWTRPSRELASRHLLLGAIGLSLAATARFQTVPMVGVMVLGLVSRIGVRRAVMPALVVSGSVATLFAVQWHWFGHVLGAAPLLEKLHPEVHGVTGSLSHKPWVGAVGLLVSPNRGLFFYSPIALIPLFGIRSALRNFPEHGIGWCLIAALAQFLAYAAYSVWWGGHTFGPRYLLDPLVLLTPAAPVALTATLVNWWTRTICAVALTWSVVISGTGVFFSDPWNREPVDVDRHHERLWDWSDLQVLRHWKAGLHPQNFNLLTWESYRRTPPAQ